MVGFFFWLFLGLFVLISLFLVLLILIQKGRGGGLSSAFGGAGGNTAFGSKTGDVLTWVTSIAFGVFLLLAIALNLLSNARQAASNADAVRIQYGGSMKPENAKGLLAQPDVDGGLIGGAALKADSFLAITKAGV